MARQEEPDLSPYLAVIREFVTDVMAEEGVPQRFWPPQPLEPSPTSAADPL